MDSRPKDDRKLLGISARFLGDSVDSRLAAVKAKPMMRCWFLGDSVDSRHLETITTTPTANGFWGIVWTAGGFPVKGEPPTSAVFGG